MLPPRNCASRTGNEKVTTQLLDLSDLSSVEGASGELIERFGRVDVLVNNAGGIWSAHQLTGDGFEHTFQVNYLSHYLLTRRLLASGGGIWPRRVVNVTSVAHRYVLSMRWDELQLGRGHMTYAAYPQSKLAQVLFTHELARRFGPSGVVAHSCNPGVVRTRVGKDGDVRGALAPLLAAVVAAGTTPAQAAATPVFLAISLDAERSNGGYWVQCKQRRPSQAARDPHTASRLWELSETLLTEAGYPPDPRTP